MEHHHVAADVPQHVMNHTAEVAPLIVQGVLLSIAAPAGILTSIAICITSAITKTYKTEPVQLVTINLVFLQALLLVINIYYVISSHYFWPVETINHARFLEAELFFGSLFTCCWFATGLTVAALTRARVIAVFKWTYAANYLTTRRMLVYVCGAWLVGLLAFVLSYTQSFCCLVSMTGHNHASDDGFNYMMFLIHACNVSVIVYMIVANVLMMLRLRQRAVRRIQRTVTRAMLSASINHRQPRVDAPPPKQPGWFRSLLADAKMKMMMKAILQSTLAGFLFGIFSCLHLLADFKYSLAEKLSISIQTLSAYSFASMIIVVVAINGRLRRQIHRVCLRPFHRGTKVSAGRGAQTQRTGIWTSQRQRTVHSMHPGTNRYFDMVDSDASKASDDEDSSVPPIDIVTQSTANIQSLGVASPAAH